MHLDIVLLIVGWLYSKHTRDLTYPAIRAYMVMQLQTHDMEVAYDLQRQLPGHHR